MTAADIVASCDASLRRLQTDVIDLYQIHWPERHVPAFGDDLLRPGQGAPPTPIHEQLEALAGLVKAGKVRAHRPVERDALRRARVRAAGRAARPAARGHGAERRTAWSTARSRTAWTKPCTGWAFRCWPIRRWLRPADRQIRPERHRRARRAAGRAHRPLRIGAQAALGPARGAEARAPLQPAGARRTA